MLEAGSAQLFPGQRKTEEHDGITQQTVGQWKDIGRVDVILLLRYLHDAYTQFNWCPSFRTETWAAAVVRAREPRGRPGVAGGPGPTAPRKFLIGATFLQQHIAAQTKAVASWMMYFCYAYDSIVSLIFPLFLPLFCEYKKCPMKKWHQPLSNAVTTSEHRTEKPYTLSFMPTPTFITAFLFLKKKQKTFNVSKHFLTIPAPSRRLPVCHSLWDVTTGGF